MPAYDPAFTAASCFILRPGASGRLLWDFTLFLWLDYIILPSGSKVNISYSQSEQKNLPNFLGILHTTWR